MTYKKTEHLTYGALMTFVGRAYTPNLHGGKVRAIGATAKASYLPDGEDGSGPEIVITYNGTTLLALTPDLLEVRGLREEHCAAAVKVMNRVLEQNAPGHRLAFDPKNIALMYNDSLIEPDFQTGEFFIDEDYGHFYKINGRTVPNYTKEAK